MEDIKWTIRRDHCLSRQTVANKNTRWRIKLFSKFPLQFPLNCLCACVLHHKINIAWSAVKPSFFFLFLEKCRLGIFSQLRNLVSGRFWLLRAVLSSRVLTLVQKPFETFFHIQTENFLLPLKTSVACQREMHNSNTKAAAKRTTNQGKKSRFVNLTNGFKYKHEPFSEFLFFDRQNQNDGSGTFLESNW